MNALLSWELDAKLNVELGYVSSNPPVNQPATLLGVPLFHATGSHAVMLASYRPQRKIVSMRKWDVEQAAFLIQRANFKLCWACDHDGGSRKVRARIELRFK